MFAVALPALPLAAAELPPLRTPDARRPATRCPPSFGCGAFERMKKIDPSYLPGAREAARTAVR